MWAEVLLIVLLMSDATASLVAHSSWRLAGRSPCDSLSAPQSETGMSPWQKWTRSRGTSMTSSLARAVSPCTLVSRRCGIDHVPIAGGGAYGRDDGHTAASKYGVAAGAMEPLQEALALAGAPPHAVSELRQCERTRIHRFDRSTGLRSVGGPGERRASRRTSGRISRVTADRAERATPGCGGH